MSEPSLYIRQLAPTRSARVLVSGASFAGLASAFWLNRLGCQVTVIDAAHELRRGGTPVDIEGQTIGRLSRMGLMDAVRAKVLPPREFQFKDADDGAMGTVARQETMGEAPVERYEIHRDDLLEILFAAVDGSATVRFGRSVERL